MPLNLFAYMNKIDLPIPPILLLYGNIAWADVDQRLALIDFFKKLRSAEDLIVKKYETTCEREKLHCAIKLGKVHTLVAKEKLYWK